jgi:hypothetical protein
VSEGFADVMCHSGVVTSCSAGAMFATREDILPAPPPPFLSSSSEITETSLEIIAHRVSHRLNAVHSLYQLFQSTFTQCRSVSELPALSAPHSTAALVQSSPVWSPFVTRLRTLGPDTSEAGDAVREAETAEHNARKRKCEAQDDRSR